MYHYEPFYAIFMVLDQVIKKPRVIGIYEIY